MLALGELAVRSSATLITRPGRRCSRSTPWAPCGFHRRLLTLWHAASGSSSSPLRAVWAQLPTILLAAQSPIAAQRPAVNMVMRSLAIELAPRGITCVVINPGWVLTDMGGPNATMTPAESVERLRDLIATLGPAQSGRFFNYDCREYPW